MNLLTVLLTCCFNILIFFSNIISIFDNENQIIWYNIL